MCVEEIRKILWPKYDALKDKEIEELIKLLDTFAVDVLEKWIKLPVENDNDAGTINPH